MTSYPPEALARAVAAICPDIQSRVPSARISDERHLWWELSCCILSSQVPFELAMAAADAIDNTGVLYDPEISDEIVHQTMISILINPLKVEQHERKYRFPKARAEQLTMTRNAVYKAEKSLMRLIDSFKDSDETRAWLVENTKGLGPKQASMFLRNSGITYEMAILDRHVLKYMQALGIHSSTNMVVSGLTQYGLLEKDLRQHADEMNCPVGLMDWAIWVVMRVANGRQENILA